MAEKMNVHTEFTGSSTGFDKTVRDVNGSMGGMLKTAKSFSAGFLSIGIAIEAAKKAMNSTEGSADDLERAMGTLQGAMQGFFRTIVTGEWESLIKNIVNTARATRDLKEALDELEDVSSTNKIRKALFEGDLEAARLGAAGTSDPATKAKFIQEAIDAQKNLTSVEKGEIDKRISIEESYFQTMMGWDDKIADYNIAKIKEIASNYEYFFGDNSVVIEGMNRRLGELQSKPGTLSGDEQTELRRLKTLKHTLEIYEQLRDVSDPGRFRNYIDLVAESIAAIAKGDKDLVRLTKQLTTSMDELDKSDHITIISRLTPSNLELSRLRELERVYKSVYNYKPQGLQSAPGAGFVTTEQIDKNNAIDAADIARMQDAVNSLTYTFMDLFDSIGQGWDDFAAQAQKAIMDVVKLILAKAAVWAILKLISKKEGTLLGDLAGEMLGGKNIAQYSLSGSFASGTNFAPGGLSLVGERGPELVNLPRGSQVIPNSQNMRVEVVGRVSGSDLALVMSRYNREFSNNT